jgi:ribosome biogenesis GTPase / thiamine phosphate phosphatase
LFTLEQLGWNATWARQWAQQEQAGHFAGRICAEHRELYDFHGASGSGTATVSGRLRHEAAGRADFPAVGDWVALRPAPHGSAVIDAVLPRVNKISRKLPGKAVDEQILAANLDTLFLVTSLNRDLNPRRIERYLAAASGWGVEPVLILSKSDLCDQPREAVERIGALANGMAVHAMSARTGAGLEALDGYLGAGRTVALLGSSGVGKSTLLNRLLNESRQVVWEIRVDDDRGRHTTTHREMFPLPQGGLVIDNPGMRELQIWDEEVDLTDAFADIAALAAQCRFSDCRHDQEPGCAVKQALADGVLSAERFENLGKLQRELAYLESQRDDDVRRERKDRERKIHRAIYKQQRKRERR